MHICMLAILLDTNQAYPQLGSAGAFQPHAADALGSRGRYLERQLSQQDPTGQCGSKATQLRAPTSSPSSARQHALKSACLVGSKPPAATAYIIWFVPWEYSYTMLTCSRGGRPHHFVVTAGAVCALCLTSAGLTPSGDGWKGRHVVK